jgi:sugar/nucleoside kinase (ribokinase family)
MKKLEVVTIGSAIKDIMFYSDEISILKNKKDLLRQNLIAVEYGAKIEIDKVFVNYGGGALNVAVGLKRFGFKVAPLIRVGKDWVGQEIYYFIKDKKIDSSLVQVDHEHPTGFSVILTAAQDKEHTIFTHKGASCFLRVPANFKQTKTDWFYVSALSIDHWEKEFEKIVEYVVRPSVDTKIMWNPGSRQLKDYRQVRAFLPQVEVLLVNKDEAIELALNLFGRKINKAKINQTRYLLDSLKVTGVKNVIITAGSRGAYGLDRDFHYYYRKAEAKKIVDTVGAGDAFGSGFLAGYLLYHDFAKALHLGIKNSAGVLSEIGAQNGLLKLSVK